MTPDNQSRRSLDVRGLVLLALAAVGLAVLAGWLLAPGGAGYGFSVPDPSAFFSAARLDEIDSYRSQTRLAAVASLVAGIGVLALFQNPNIRTLAREIEGRQGSVESVVQRRAQQQAEALQRLQRARRAR